ncbi:MAG: histidine kinase [Chroococcidiopsidaceae cyanobacterium CP_BM_ER_R8_30]|nr:histidine kinase [Chroococcidiopsidaceae cyanobacterium CP_BM_ER_R8_30]
MSISDEEKQQIMQDLSQGNPEFPNQSSTQPLNDQKVDSAEYQNFDNFAQHNSQGGQLPDKAAMTDLLKERIQNNLKQAKEAGQLRAGRVREIVQEAVSQVVEEFKSGSKDIRSITKDAVFTAVSTVTENLQEKGGEIKEEVTASIEGVIEGISRLRRQSIAKTQAEVEQLQARLDSEEEALQKEVEQILNDVEETGKDTSPKIKASIQSAIKALKDSDEVRLMQKRYTQLQAQAAILRANLAARYGGRSEEVKEHLDDPKTWYDQTRPKAEAVADQIDQKRSQLDEKLGDAGVAIAKKERRIRQVLSELLQAAANLLREKEPPSK